MSANELGAENTRGLIHTANMSETPPHESLRLLAAAGSSRDGTRRRGVDVAEESIRPALRQRPLIQPCWSRTRGRPEWFSSADPAENLVVPLKELPSFH